MQMIQKQYARRFQNLSIKYFINQCIIFRSILLGLMSFSQKKFAVSIDDFRHVFTLCSF